MDIQAYLDAIKQRLAISPIITEVQVVQARSLEDRGFIRARLRLVNDDFVEAAEFFVSAQGQVRTVEYRYQWMDSAKQCLRKRWDNAAHHPGLPHFPHDVHVGVEGLVEPGEPMGTIELLDLLEQEIGGIL